VDIGCQTIIAFGPAPKSIYSRAIISRAVPAAEGVQGALYRLQVFLHDMGVNFGGLDVRMPHQLLNDPDVDAVFQQMRRVAVPKRVTGNPLGQSGAMDR